MAKQKREPIEKSIRGLSLQIRKELLEQQKQGQPQRINTEMLEHMLYAWGELAKYYENSIYQTHANDLEINLFIVGNYLRWSRNLQIFIVAAKKEGEQDRADELEEMLSTLEGHMEDILAAVSTVDNMNL